MAPREPFKFLDAYTRDDGAIFFGRDAESEELHSRVLRSRLLLVYGPSGTGKTSLMQCGLGNQFDEADWFPVFLRYGDGIFRSIDAELEKRAVTAINPDISLAEKVHSVYLDYFKPIYLIFDQFEELFLFGTVDECERLAAAIVSLLDVSFALKVIFVLREEYLAELTAFEDALPDLFSNRFRVERMGRSNAIRAIESPCKVCGIGIEDGLAEHILARLGTGKTGTVELTYLQVLLDKLVKKAVETRPETPTLTIADLEALGTMGDILGEFLDEQLAAMGEEEASLGETVLKTLITPDGTKKTMGRPEIVSVLRGMEQAVAPEQVAAVLNHFVSVRILSEREDSGQYELRHDSLAQKIFERMSTLEKDLLEVMQMVENRYKEYQTRGTFLDQAALEYVSPYESRLRFKPQIAGFISASRRELTRVRRKKRTALFASLIAILVVVSGLGILSYLSYLTSEKQRKRAEQQTEIAQEHLQQSKLNEIDALNQTSKALFLTHDELGAVLAGVKAGISVTQTDVRPTLKFQTIFNLLELMDNVQEKNRLAGHNLNVMSVAFSPDGSLLASGSGDGTITLWNAADGRTLNTLRGGYSSLIRTVQSVAFSPDGTLLASGSADGSIKLWQVADGSELNRLQLHGRAVAIQSVAFSPDGTLLAAGRGDGTIKLWQVADGRERITFPGHTASVQSIAFSPDGTLLASGSTDKTITLWHVADGRERATLKGHTDTILSIAFSPDGTLLASGSSDDTIKLWQMADGQELTTLHGHTNTVRSIAFSPDGTLVASGSYDKTIILWEISEKNIRQTFRGHAEGITSVVFSPDGTLLASGSLDKTIKFWQVADNPELTTTLSGHVDTIFDVTFSPDGSLLASGSDDRTIKLWNVADGRELTTLPRHASEVWSVTFSPDGALLTWGSRDNTIKLWQVADSREFATLPGHASQVVSVTFSPDSALLASGSADSTIKLWQVADGQELTTLPGHAGWVNSVAFSPDGTLLASGSGDQTIKLWQVADGRELITLHGHTSWVNSVAFSPDGTLLASGSGDQTIKLWQVAEGRELITLHGHAGEVWSVTFSPDGTLLASGSADQTIKVWQVGNGQELTTLYGHSGSIESVAFSPDGTLLASGGHDRAIKLWHLNLDYLLVRGCEWLHGYLITNPNVSDIDRGMCDEVLQ